MRLLISVMASLFVIACTQTTTQEGELIPATTLNNTEIVGGPVLSKPKSYRFYIPGIFTNNFKNDIDTSVFENFLSINDGQLLAKKYWRNGQELTAISFDYMSSEQGIMKNASHILGRNEAGDIIDLMDEIFPEMDVYAFYDFGDKPLKQLEGDEQTVFAGYKLDLSKEDSLGVQFMFCNKKDSFDTKVLNDNGVVRYVGMGPK